MAKNKTIKAKSNAKTFTLKGAYADKKQGDKVQLGKKGEAFYKSLNLI